MKITYDGVLIEPQYSEVRSRSDVKLTTKLKNLTLELPIISANMKTVTGSSMVESMFYAGGLGILHRFCTVRENVSMFTDLSFKIDISKIGVSVGVKEDEQFRFKMLYRAGARLFCVDVAHGDHILVKEMISFIRSKDMNNDITIIAGNVATPDAAFRVYEWGADIIKVGIGPGCFIPSTQVMTSKGYKEIQNICIGDDVLTHLGNYKSVTNTVKYHTSDDLIKINGIITCTESHKFYVIDMEYENIVNEDNIHDYAVWVSAKDLNANHLLILLE
jgi:IMP dehydrogenase/GMP reductase